MVSTVGRYELLETVGSGGCATVRVARNSKTGKLFALKIFLPDQERNMMREAKF